MMSRLRHALCILASVGSSRLLAAQGGGYHLVGRIVTDSGSQGFLSIDPTHRRLYGVGDRVIDLDRERPGGTLHNAEHGFVLAPDLGRGLGMDGGVFDLSTLASLGRLDMDGYTSAYDSLTGRALVLRRNAWVVDVRHGAVVGTVDLGADPQSGVSDGAGRVYVNLGRRDSMAVIDARTLQVVDRWSLPGCHGAIGLSIDRAHRRLFASCQRMLVVVDADNGRIVASIPVAHGAMQNAFDPTTGFIFNPNGIGSDSTMTIIAEEGADTYRVVERVPIGPEGTRLATVDPRTHRVYVVALSDDAGRCAVLVFAPARAF
jgi:hypothetical protein